MLARRILIYGTVYNNANRIVASLASVAPLMPHKFYVVDNYSFDGTYEILRKHKNIEVTQMRCKRGKGRGMALKMLLKEARPDDYVLHIDFDVVYKQAYIDIVKKKAKSLCDNEIYFDFGELSTARTNQGLEWANLNAFEDVERCAAALEKGIRVYRMRAHGEEFWHKFWENEEVVGKKREARYEKNLLKTYLRFFVHVMDAERGGAYTHFSEFYNISGVRSPQHFLVYFFAFIAARLKGTYRHDKELDNPSFIEKRVTYIQE